MHKKTNSNTKIRKKQASNTTGQKIFNIKGIIAPYQFVFITVLIISSVVSITLSSDQAKTHIRQLSYYFNFYMLNNTYMGLYDIGENIDEPFTQVVTLTDMRQHFLNIIEKYNGFMGDDGFPQFFNIPQKNIEFNIQFQNQSTSQKTINIQQLQEFFNTTDLKLFLLNVLQFRIVINFGQNKMLDNFKLRMDYKIHSKAMLSINLFHAFKQNSNNKNVKASYSFRYIEQGCAFILIVSYLYKIGQLNVQIKKDIAQFTLYQNSALNSQLNINQSQKNSQLLVIQKREKQSKNKIYWCYSLIFLNLVTITSETFSPLASFLQLLPIFQHNEEITETTKNDFNFNVNLRYALPYILYILVPTYIFLNGFIMFSLLNYPGQYFDDYLKGFFSYTYNNFQVGTYQIFMELKNKGTLSYLLYAVLYFYMVLVANNLIIALFSTLVQRSIMQQSINEYILLKVENAVCPHCLYKNVKNENESQIELNMYIKSPKMSPYMRPQINANEKSKKLNVFLQEEITYSGNMQFLKYKSLKIEAIKQKLLSYIDIKQKNKHKAFLKQYESKIEKFLTKIKI